MSYVRKTYDEWQLLGDYGYGHGFELLTAASTYQEIKEHKKEYRENDHSVQRLKVKCVRVPKRL